MIRVVTLTDWPEDATLRLVQRLFMAFGLGAEHTGRRETPKAAQTPEGLDPVRLLASAPQVPAYGDDKVLLVVDEPLVQPEGPLGRAPNPGFSDVESGRAVVSTAGLVPSPPADEAAWELLADRVARHAIQQIGLLWGLHRCPDPRCAMSVPWRVPHRDDVAGTTLCDWCRSRSEERMSRSRT